MKNKTIILIVALVLVVCCCLTACNNSSKKATDITKLATPTVVISKDGLASWSAVNGAVGYAYILDNGNEVKTTALYRKLTPGQSIKVKACGNGKTYKDSDYSVIKTYRVINENDPNVVNIDIFGVNDLHGKFMDTEKQPGVDEFTTYMKNLYEDDSRYEILLSSGDMWQGTVESSTNKGALMTEWMNEVGFVSMTLGNHEYDWGNAGIQSIADMANFPILGINVRVDGVQPEYAKSSVIVERGGVKIGIIGAIGNCLSSISGEFTGGLSFLYGEKLSALVRSESTSLREQGCDIIVYSLHDGFENSSQDVMDIKGPLRSGNYVYYDTDLSNGYVDLVFEGHTHKNYVLCDEYGVYHIQSGGENQAVGVAKIAFDSQTRQFSVSTEKISSYVYGSSEIQDDPSINEIYNKYFPEEDPYTVVIGKNNYYKNGDAICDTLAKLYLEKGISEWGDEYDIVLGGGYLKTRSPYYIAAGDITYSQIFSVLPFDNTIILGKISGEMLLSQFINTSNGAYHTYCNPLFDTSTINPTSDYYIIVDSYTAYYSYNKITVVARIENLYPRDVLKEFIANGDWSN